MADTLQNDRFFVSLDYEQIEWLSYDPVTKQYGYHVFDRTVFQEACQSADDAKDIFALLKGKDTGKVYTQDHPFAEAIKIRMLSERPDAAGATMNTLKNIRLLFEAKDLIDDYILSEFQEPSSYESMRTIGAGHTTTEDDKHEIQAYINLADHRFETYMDGTLAYFQEFRSLEEMVNHGLRCLSFDDLTYVPDWIIQDRENTEKKHLLAVGLVDFFREIQVEGYQNVLNKGMKYDSMVGQMYVNLSRDDHIQTMFDLVEDAVKNEELTLQQYTRAIGMMEDLHRLQSEIWLLPVENREPLILEGFIKAMNLPNYTVSANENGTTIRKGEKVWSAKDFCAFAASITDAEWWKKFRTTDFGLSTDFKDLCAHHGIQLDRRVPVRRKGEAR